MFDYPTPILGICAYSGTGKTTLLTSVLPILRERGVNVAVVKHAHHSFELDYPGKDSYELRKAGAAQLLVASRQRIAMIREYEVEQPEPVLLDALELLNPKDIDLVLVEGFKREALPKIELYRASRGRPLMCTDDLNIIAVASDSAVDLPRRLPLLNLNQSGQIADFILHQAGLIPSDEQTKLRCR